MFSDFDQLSATTHARAGAVQKGELGPSGDAHGARAGRLRAVAALPLHDDPEPRLGGRHDGERCSREGGAEMRAAIAAGHPYSVQSMEEDAMNVLALGARVVGEALALEFLRAFLDARPSDEERHRRRTAKTRAIEARTLQGGAT